LEKAVVIDSCRIASDIVTMHSRVRYVDQHAGEVREVTIVFPHEANDSTASISVLASVGTALLGLAVGQSIVWPFPDGTQHCLRVLKIIYQPEADDPAQRTKERRVTACPLRRAALTWDGFRCNSLVVLGTASRGQRYGRDPAPVSFRAATPFPRRRRRKC
jgi:regulator of nucleoside diphosphate kinase